MRKTKKILWMALGFISLGAGAVGVVLPLLPAFPFLLLTLISFAKSSRKLEIWFRSTKMYKKHLEPFLERRVMTRKTKMTIMTSMTLFMGIGFWFMGAVPVGRAVLAAVWLFHMFYFVKAVKTVPDAELEAD